MGSCYYRHGFGDSDSCRCVGCFRRAEAQADDSTVNPRRGGRVVPDLMLPEDVEGHRIITSLSGVNRSDPAGKPDYTLVDLRMLERWAAHMTAHIASKGRNNWRNADTMDDLERFRASAWRHFVAWQRGDTDEDHAAALFFNVAGAELAARRLEAKF